MTEADEADEADHPITEITVFLVLGAGFVGMIAGVDWFWAIWVVGFAALLPLVDTVADHYLAREGDGGDAATDEAEDDALDRLRERYAAGDIDEAEFERRVDRLLETEDEATARELRSDRGSRPTDAEYATDPEVGGDAGRDSEREFETERE